MCTWGKLSSSIPHIISALMSHLSGGRLSEISKSLSISLQSRPASSAPVSQWATSLDDKTARGSLTRWTTWALVSKFIKRILHHSLYSFLILACISLLPIQDSRFSFLSLMVLMTLRLEVWHLPRTTLLYFISLLSLWRTSWSANLALAWPSDCDVGPSVGKLESAYFRK